MTSNFLGHIQWNQRSHIFKFLHVTQLSYKRMFHNYRASAINVPVTCQSHFWLMSHVSWLILVWDMTQSCMAWRIHMSVTCQSHCTCLHPSYISDMTHSYVRHDSITCDWYATPMWLRHATYNWVMTHTGMSHDTWDMSQKCDWYVIQMSVTCQSHCTRLHPSFISDTTHSYARHDSITCDWHATPMWLRAICHIT